MSRGLIVPIAALITAVFKEILGIELEQESVETTINTLLILIAGLGIFIGRSKR